MGEVAERERCARDKMRIRKGLLQLGEPLTKPNQGKDLAAGTQREGKELFTSFFISIPSGPVTEFLLSQKCGYSSLHSNKTGFRV